MGHSCWGVPRGEHCGVIQAYEVAGKIQLPLTGGDSAGQALFLRGSQLHPEGKEHAVYWVARSCPLCSLKLRTSHRRLGVEAGKLRIDFVTKAVGHEHARGMCFALNLQHYRYEHPIFPFMTGGAQRSCAACTAMTDVHLLLVGVWMDEGYQVPCKRSWLQLSTHLRTTHPSAQAIARSADFTRRRRASLVLRRGSFDGDAWWWGKQREIN